MDTRLFMFSPLPFIYSTYPPPSPQSTRTQLQTNVVLSFALFLFSLSLIATFPRKSRPGNEHSLDAVPQVIGAETTTTSSPSPLKTSTRMTSTPDRTLIRLQRQNARLVASVRALQLTIRHNAFAAFRDRLILSNRIWAQEKEITLLRSDGHALRQVSVSSVPVPVGNDDSSSPSAEEHIRVLEAKIAALEHARTADAAAQDALDERREYLVAELIREISADLEESQRQVEHLRAKLCVPSDTDGDSEGQRNVLGESNRETGTEIKPDTGAESDLDQTLCNELWTSKEDDNNSQILAYSDPDRATMDDLFSDPGSPTSTVAGDEEHDTDGDEDTDYTSDVIPNSPLALKLRLLESPSPPRTPSPPPSPSSSPSPSPPSSGTSKTFPKFRASTLTRLHVHPQSPGELALGNGAAPYTTSARLLARCARARSAIVSGRRALRFPMWSQQVAMLGPVLEAGESTATVNIFPGRSSKRARVDSDRS